VRRRPLTLTAVASDLRDALADQAKPFACPTPCEPGCRARCHELHHPAARRVHDPTACQLVAGAERLVIAPENTARRDLLVHLAGMLSEGTSGYIEGMEAAGQRQLVASTTLPADAPWAELEALGFTRGEKVDDLFVRATLPGGWRKEGSDHAMWSYVLDERGIRRVAVFYKAAFYDRRAFASIHNVGRAASTDALYADGPAALPPEWAVFTDAERADFVAGLDGMAADIEDYPSVYAARLADLRTLLAAMPE
jgi:hypothetical protein